MTKLEKVLASDSKLTKEDVLAFCPDDYGLDSACMFDDCNACWNSEVSTISYWDNITKIYKKQAEKGIKEYRMKLEENAGLTASQRLTLLEEELVDALVYLEHLKLKVAQYEQI